jgi:hypothetical protein
MGTRRVAAIRRASQPAKSAVAARSLTTVNVPTVSEAYKYAAYDGLGAVGR